MSTKQGRYLWHLATQDVGTLHLEKKLIITSYVEAGGRGFKACYAGNISINFFFQLGPYLSCFHLIQVYCQDEMKHETYDTFFKNSQTTISEFCIAAFNTLYLSNFSPFLHKTLLMVLYALANLQ